MTRKPSIEPDGCDDACETMHVELLELDEENQYFRQIRHEEEEDDDDDRR